MSHYYYECMQSQDCGQNDIEWGSWTTTECVERCDANPVCVTYVKNPQGNYCWLKSVCDSTQMTVSSQRIACFKRIGCKYIVSAEFSFNK